LDECQSAQFRLWVIIVLLLLALFTVFQNPGQRSVSQDISFSQLLNDVDQGKVRDVVIQGPEIHGTYTDGRGFNTYAPNDPSLVAAPLQQAGHHHGAPPAGQRAVVRFAAGVLAAFHRAHRRMDISVPPDAGRGRQGARLRQVAREAFELRRTDAVTFEDVAGVDEAKQDLQEIVEFLRDPGKYQRLGGRIPRGVLLVGPPGTGKTLIARAVAGEAMCRSSRFRAPTFVEMFVGVGASRVRDMFEQAKKNAPCIIFIDEIDAVGRPPRRRPWRGNDEREQTLNQLLVEMGRLRGERGHHPHRRDQSSRRARPRTAAARRFDPPGRGANPDIVGREAILKVHVRKVPLAPDVNLKTVARGTPGFSGADLMNLVNEAALMAARRKQAHG